MMHDRSRIDISQESEIAIGRRSRLVHGILGGFLGVAYRLLTLALHFLNGAFALQTVVASGFADALLGLAHRLVGGAFNLVCDATHEISPCSGVAGTSFEAAKRSLKPACRLGGGRCFR